MNREYPAYGFCSSDDSLPAVKGFWNVDHPLYLHRLELSDVCAKFAWGYTPGDFTNETVFEEFLVSEGKVKVFEKTQAGNATWKLVETNLLWR